MINKLKHVLKDTAILRFLYLLMVIFQVYSLKITIVIIIEERKLLEKTTALKLRKKEL